MLEVSFVFIVYTHLAIQRQNKYEVWIETVCKSLICSDSRKTNVSGGGSVVLLHLSSFHDFGHVRMEMNNNFMSEPFL